jgi:putative phage-type endonuclease
MTDLLTAPPAPLLPADAAIATWLEMRRTGIGGSDVAAILGVSKYAGPTRVYYDKLGVLPDQDNAAMEWGRRLEAAVRTKFADEHPEFTVTTGPGLVAHPQRRWQLATIDGLIADAGCNDPVALLEVKTGRAGAEDWGDELTDEVPLPYVCQVTWYLDVYGLHVGYLAVLLDGRDYREYVIEYDPALAAKLRGHCETFWRRHVQSQVPPDPDGLADTAAVLDVLHRPAQRSRADLPAEVVDWARVYGIAHQAELRARQRKQEAGNHLRAAFIAAGSPHEGWVDGRKVASYPLCGQPTTDVTDWAALAADHPDLAARYRRTVPVEQQRRLIVSKEFTTS